VNKISADISLRDLALRVGGVLKDAGIDGVLSGGAVVSIYTRNRYQSYDLDFITHSSLKDLEVALSPLGFVREGRLFHHPDTDYYLDFPAPPLSVGNRPVSEFNELREQSGYLKLLTPTHCVMDRLAAYFYWNDHQALEQALMVANAQNIVMDEVRSWSEAEGMSDRFRVFADRLKKKGEE